MSQWFTGIYTLLNCQASPHPRLPIINCLCTIIYPTLSWRLKHQPAGWSLMGGCPARAPCCPQQSRAGKPGGSMGWGGQEGQWVRGLVPVCGRSVRKMGGGTNLVFFLSVLGFGALSHTELVLQYGSLVPKETVCESLN